MRSRESGSISPTRIVYVINSLDSGGAERHLVRVIGGLRRTGRWQISVFCLTRRGLFLTEMEELGVQVHGSARSWTQSPALIWNAIVDLRTHLRAERPQIVHCYLPQASLIGALAARWARVPHVVTSRRFVHSYAGRNLVRHRVVCAVADRCSDRVIAVCNAATEQAVTEGTPRRKLVTVYNSITLPSVERRRRNFFDGKPVFGSVGELHPRKGFQYLIEAMPQVLAALPQARLLIVGRGQDRSRLEQIVLNCGVGEHVEFLGERSDIPDLLAEFDVFVLPSLLEGIPNALLEAMAAGLPSVATRVGGVPELLEDRKQGFLVNAKSPTELARALIELGRDQDMCAAFGARAQALVAERFQPQREIDGIERVYRTLLEKPQGSRLGRLDRAQS